MKKRFLPVWLVLALALALPALGAEEPPAQTYEEVVAQLRDRGNYTIEEFLDCQLCSVFLGHWVGTPHSAYHELTLVYKAGSPLGDGTTVELPLQKDNEDWGTTRSPSILELNEDKSGLRYTYYAPELGTDVYSVDLATGEVTTAHVPPSYEDLLGAYAWESTVEQQLEAPHCRVALLWSDLAEGSQEPTVRSYTLALLFPEAPEPEKRFQRLLLPSTAAVEGEFASQYPTHRPPDSLSLNEKGSVLTYTYSFDAPLSNADGQNLHETGSYTYTVKLPSGELSVEYTPLPADPVFSDVPQDSWFARGVATCAREGIMMGTGEDTFSPEATLTYPECVMLAYRLYDKAHGGDGSLLRAPEDWGYMTLETDDGSLCYGGVGGDPYVWGSFFPDGPTGRALFYLLPRDEEMNDLFFRIPLDSGATVTLEGRSFHGTVSILRRPMSHTHYFTFSPDELSADQDLLSAVDIPAGDKWWRDLAYTIRQRGWEELFQLYPQAHTAIRHTFADQLAAVTHLPQRFAVPDIPDLSREDFPQVFRLYEAGILGGTDDYGTFSGGGELTRAEAAVMVARVLDESQRLNEPPKPMPAVDPESYTLTYLTEGQIILLMNPVTFPLCPIYRSTEETPYEPLGLLTLEGELLPWTAEGMELSSLERQGPYLMAYFQREEPDFRYTTGVLDETGQWIVAPGEFESVWPRAEGFGASNGSNEDYRAFLLDGQGQVLAQTDREDPALAAVDLPVPEPWGGLTLPNSWVPGQRYYLRPDGSPASGWFDNCGELGPDGRGFVEKDGKIYRIQFTTREEE